MMIYGKIFAAMFSGSLYGSGSHVFTTMSYAISHMQPDKDGEEYVTINPQELAHKVGEPLEKIESAIKFLCSPDPKTPDDEKKGRRLIKVGVFDYHVVKGKHYRSITNEDDRKTKNAARQQKWRDKQKNKEDLHHSQGAVGEATYVRTGMAPHEHGNDNLSDHR